MSTYDQMRYTLTLARRLPDPNSPPIPASRIAPAVGAGEKAIRAWETGHTYPRFDAFHAWARALGHTVRLVTGDDMQVYDGTAAAQVSILAMRRQVRGWSMVAVGEYVGVVHGAISAWEDGRSWPLATNFIAYAEAVDATVELVKREQLE